MTRRSTGLDYCSDVLHQRVYRAVVEDAVLGWSRLIDQSQRQLVETTDLCRTTINQCLQRLLSSEALQLPDDHAQARGAKYVLPSLTVLSGLLYVPVASTAVVPYSSVVDSSAAPPPEGTEDGPVFAAAVHRLFGSKGLSAGAEKTFAYLPEWKQDVGHGRALVRVTKGMAQSGRSPKHSQARRSVPGASRGDGRSVAALSSLTCQSLSTVRGQLREMAGKGLAFSIGRRWWRYRFDADWLADHLQIPDTAAQKAELHRQERQALWSPGPRDRRDAEICVDPTTGEVLTKP